MTIKRISILINNCDECRFRNRDGVCWVFAEDVNEGRCQECIDAEMDIRSNEDNDSLVAASDAGYTHKQIAEQLGVTQAAIKSRIARHRNLVAQLARYDRVKDRRLYGEVMARSDGDALDRCEEILGGLPRMAQDRVITALAHWWGYNAREQND